MTKTIAAVITALLMLPSVAHAWWNDEWTFRKQITFNTGKDGADLQQGLADVPVLVRLHTGNFQYFTDVAADGADIRFIDADDQTPLKFHIEKFDVANQMAFIWVKAPKLAVGESSDTIWMYYGNAKAAPAQDAAGTYDKNQALVYHFDTATGTPQDRTTHAIQPERSTAQPQAASLIGAGTRFDGSNMLAIPTAPALRMTAEQGWTFSAWIKPDGPQNDAYLVHSRDGDSALVLGMQGHAAYARYRNAQGRVFETPKSAALTPGAWYHVAVVAGAGHLRVYLNGAEASSIEAALNDKGGTLTLGAADGGTNFFKGEIDEVQISNIARTPDWLKAAVHGQGGDAGLMSFGEDEQAQNAAGTSYFMVTLQNVTVDGWAVIGVLVVMGVISWIVMFGKGLVVGRVRKDNRAFLQQFKQLGAGDPHALDAIESEEEKAFEHSPVSMVLFGKHDHFQGSSLYHIYHAGVREVDLRLGRAVGAQTTLTPQAINTIRAALDAALVRETQKLNSQMVLLTIAISGGPFLGLLGTVVGVMITFAAIAASGDVNVNAIAPGIAAALVATVAGLAVAIPALFGYNYLSSRIKEISADMHVFVDEFTTKIAEHYAI